MAWDAGVIEARLTIATAEASADLAKIEAQVKALTDRANVVKVTADTAAATDDLAKLDAEIKALTDRANVIKVTADTGAATDALVKLDAEIKALDDNARIIQLGAAADTAGATAAIAKLDAEAQALDDGEHTVKFGAVASTGQATADLAKIDAEVKALTGRPHVINIVAVFDDADISLARRDFMLLDDAISVDAMQRLRSSPQGSVLGALNALFSPHPVLGGPSPEQAASSGLLGQMISQQGGGTAVIPPAEGNGSVLRDVVTGTVPPQDVAAGTAGTTAAEATAAGAGAGTLADAADAEKAAAAEQAAAAAALSGAAAGLRDAAGSLSRSAGLEAGVQPGALTGQHGGAGAGAAAAAGTAAGSGGSGDTGLSAGAAAAATGALTQMDDAVRKAYDDYTVLAAEMNDLREPAILAAVPELNQFDSVLKHISGDLEALSQPGQASAAALAQLQADIGDAGTALDRLEQGLPGALADLDALQASAVSGGTAVAAAGDRYANASAEMAALGGAAKDSGDQSQSAAAKLLGLAAAAGTAQAAAQYASAAQKAFTGTETDVGAAAKDAAVQLSAMAGAATSGGDASRYAYAAQVAQALSLKAVAAASGDAAAKTAAVGAAAGGAAGNVGFLQQHITLFGGALGTVPWVGTVTGLHILIDSLVETAAEVIPAAIAFGAFAAAAVPAVKSIYDQEEALYTVSQAFNQQMPGLSGGFAKVAAAVRPQVYVLFGEALNTMNRNTGTFMTLATGAGGVLDNLGARAETALGSKGVTGFAALAVDDLRVLGNIAGNVAGIFGNFLKVMPGYAEILFHGLQDVTGALEAMTASPVVQGILSVGLGLHGAIVWGGLAASGFVLVGNAALGLVQKFGILKGAEIGLFDTAAMGAAFNAIGIGLASMGADLLGLDAAWAVSEGEATAWAGVMDALKAVNPLGWVAIGIGAIAGLVVWLGSMKTASQEAFDAFQKQIAGATTFTTAFTAISQGVQQANAQLAQTPEYIKVTTVGMHGLTSTVTELNPAWSALTSNVKAYGAENTTLTSRMSELDKITGSQANTLADLNQLGIQAGSIANESASAFANQETQVQALATATTQLAGFTGGQAAAAQNALTNSFMTGTLPAIQQVTTAEENLLSMITGGQTAFDTYGQGMHTLGVDAATAGSSMGGLNNQSFALNQQFYAQVSNAQKVVDALQMQDISTKNLTTATATMAGQMLTSAGSSTAARATIRDLINNALGPGTVSMQNLNTWVKNNSTSFQGLSTIVAQSTIDASQLAGVLQGNLNPMMAASIIAADGGQKAFDNFAAGVLNGNTKSQSFLTSGAQVISQLLASGLNAGGAKTKFDAYATSLGLSTSQANGLWASLVNEKLTEVGNKAAETRTQFEQLAAQLGISKTAADNMWTSLHRVSADSPYNATVNVTGTGSGGVTVHVGSGPGAGSTAISFNGYAYDSGGMVTGGTPGRDSVLAAVMPGEVIVPAAMVSAGAVDHLRGKLPGFAAGGFVPGNWVNAASGVYGHDVAHVESSDLTTAIQGLLANLAAAQAAAAKAAASTFISTGGASGGIIQAMFKTMAAAHGWTGAQLTALLEVEAREAGFSMTATNPSSGAYGLAQFIGGPAEYAQYGGNSTTAAGQITGMLNYIAQRWGTPEAAWANEVSSGWYDQGGSLSPGYTLAYNGTGKPEQVIPGGSGGFSMSDVVSRLDAIHADNQRLIRATEQVPAGVGKHVGGAINGASQAASFRARYPRGN